MRKLIKPGRITALVVMLVALLGIYVYFLYQVQIVEGTERYNSATAITKDTRTVTAARGNILDRYGRVLVSNKECYNLVIDSTKLFANDDPNAVILELIEMVRGFGDTYTDDLPITTEPPFEYTDMTEIQRMQAETEEATVILQYVGASPLVPFSDVRASLTDMLRNNYHLTSVKKGCEVGECGACTALIDRARQHADFEGTGAAPLDASQRRAGYHQRDYL